MFVDTIAVAPPAVEQPVAIANSDLLANNTVVTTTTHNQQQQQHGLAPVISAAELQRQEGSTAQIINISSKVNEKILFHINSLPTELLSKIFLRVPYEQRIRAERVCHFWFHIICSHSCWTDLHRLKVKIGSAEVGQQNLDQTHSILKRVGPHLHEFWLELEERALSTPPELYQHLACLTQNLRHFALFIKWEKLDHHLHYNAVDLAKNLISLAISSESWTNSRIMECLSSLIQNCSRLENLYLLVGSFLISYGDPVKKLPSTLKYLAIGPRHKAITTCLLTKAARDCPDLCALSMELEPGEKQEELIAKFKKLKWLHIKAGIDSNVLGHLLQHKFCFATLQYLSFRLNCMQDSNYEPFRLICSKCSQLKIFNFHFTSKHANKLEPLWELTKLRQLRHLKILFWQRFGDIQNFQNILKAIAAHGKLEVLLINGVKFGPAEHVVNSLIRPCKSISLFNYPDFDPKEANAFCTLIEQLVVEEEEEEKNEMTGEFTASSYNGDDKANNKRRRRNLPIHVVLNKDLAQNAALPCSEFVCWHASQHSEEVCEIVDQNRHEILGWTKSVPRFMFDDDYFLAKDVNDSENNTLLL